MSGYGYSFVTDKGFLAFARELEQGAWRPISLKKYDNPDALSKAPLADAPLAVAWKLRATWGIRALSAAVGTDILIELDQEWDSAQRALSYAVSAAEEHKKKDIRRAAARVRAALLSGAGTAQTQLALEQEVDFGRNQHDLASKKPLADDVIAIGASEHLARIHEATEALAKGLGRDSNKGRAPSRARRVRDALAACSTAFNGIHEEIAWAIDHSADGDERARLAQLLAPFEKLLARYPASGGVPADDASAEADASKTDATTPA
jgi:hypothetical protein